MMKHFTHLVLILALVWFAIGSGAAIAEPMAPVAAPVALPPLSQSFLEKLERLRDDASLRELVQEDLEKSIVIRSQIQTEVDRAFSHTTTLLNVLLAILTCLPVLAGVSIWFLRRSVITQITAETKKQLEAEVTQQFEAEVAAELQQQAEAFQQKLEALEVEFQTQLAQIKTLFLDTQQEKDRIIQELAQITPSPVRDSATPETHQKIQALTQQLERLQATNAQLCFTASDYVEQGKALYAEGRYADAIMAFDHALERESANPKAWFSRGAALVKLQQYEAAVSAYDRGIEINPEFSEAWFGKGTALFKLQQYAGAIAAYDRAIALKPDFFFAWFGKARCEVVQGHYDAAIAALSQALHLNPDKGQELLKSDATFDPIRDLEGYQQLINSSPGRI